jgi:hypothetical protein
MKRTVLAMSLLFAANACSTLPRPPETKHLDRGGVAERGTAPVHAKRARVLATGPAVLEHVEAKGAGAVTLYLTDDPGIGDRVCPSASAEGASPLAVLGPGSLVTDLAVPDGRRLCVAASDARTMSVTWHTVAATETYRRALALALAAP